jgi:hypothetical protein
VLSLRRTPVGASFQILCPLLVCLPESFRGGCSFGAVTDTRQSLPTAVSVLKLSFQVQDYDLPCLLRQATVLVLIGSQICESVPCMLWRRRKFKQEFFDPVLSYSSYTHEQAKERRGPFHVGRAAQRLWCAEAIHSRNDFSTADRDKSLVMKTILERRSASGHASHSTGG